VTELGEILRRHLPELGTPGAGWLGPAVILITGSVRVHSRPSAAVLAAYEMEPGLAVFRLDFAAAVRGLLEVLIAGLLARAGQDE
jgi:hypothetical protein